ncbi:MAG: hypothetical protein A7315_01975 [Candidatus Altiarchaeales archaeon WOR_SM1_79]|nr:MAG: hypothetical protein A7315_01975 [Candidatus Altiarchaeales archaeon WOR_SM1_79]
MRIFYLSFRIENLMKLNIKKSVLIVMSASLMFLFSFCDNQKKPSWMKEDSLIEASEIDISSYFFFIRWLDKYGKDPIQYVVEKCKEHQVVIFGEVHGIKEYLDMFNLIIPEAYHKAGVRSVLLEVGNTEMNEKIARLVEGDKYNEDLALEIARSENWGTWGYKEYWDIFETVWRLNSTLSKDKEHMKVIGINQKIDLKLNWLWRNNLLTDKKLIEKAEAQASHWRNPDEFMAEIIEKEVINKEMKGIVWVGGYHAFTHYAYPNVNSELHLAKELPRMGYLLFQKYGEKIFQIACHYSYNSPSYIYERYGKIYKGGEPILDRFIEDIMAKRGNKPVGFDVFLSPFANIRDQNLELFHWQPSVKFSDICRGYIFIQPCKKLSRCTWIENFITEDMFEKWKLYFESAYKKKFQNYIEVNEYRAGQR